MLRATRLYRQKNPNCARSDSYGLTSGDKANRELKACRVPFMGAGSLACGKNYDRGGAQESWKPCRFDD